MTLQPGWRACRPALTALMGLAALTLAGCAGKPIQSEAFIKSVPPEQAMVMPPPAGPAVVSIIERRFNNAISQDIHLGTDASTPGQNMLKVQLYGTESAYRHADNSLGMSSITEGRISSEMRQSLPRIAMAKSQFYVQNAYGPFGYAFGRGRGSDLCLYAWQQIRTRDQGTPFANYGVIQIRLRTCEANATEQKLLSVMYNFTINASVDALGWNPYGANREFNSAVGTTGAPIYPRPASAEPIVQTLPPRQTTSYAPRVQVRRVQPAPRAVAPPVSQPQPQLEPRGPRVPSPFGGGYSSATGRPSDGYAAATSSSGTTAPAAQRVTVPSPSCTMATDGADVVCR
ncbi:cellulose biosynthesis protein BcsN [Aliirhizobium smilacinae]|nr:cellulose biosynthesis protein BcsN [Rhizobium smilacinae]